MTDGAPRGSKDADKFARLRIWREGVGIEPTSRREPASAVLKTVRATRPVLSHVRSCTDSRPTRQGPFARESCYWLERIQRDAPLIPGRIILSVIGIVHTIPGNRVRAFVVIRESIGEPREAGDRLLAILVH